MTSNMMPSEPRKLLERKYNFFIDLISWLNVSANNFVLLWQKLKRTKCFLIYFFHDRFLKWISTFVTLHSVCGKVCFRYYVTVLHHLFFVLIATCFCILEERNCQLCQFTRKQLECIEQGEPEEKSRKLCCALVQLVDGFTHLPLNQHQRNEDMILRISA